MQKRLFFCSMILSCALVACTKKSSQQTTQHRVDAQIVETRKTTLKRLIPNSFNASSESLKPGNLHPASNAFDGNISTMWKESVRGSSKGEWIEAHFLSPQRIRSFTVKMDINTCIKQQPNASLDDNSHVKSVTITFDGSLPVQKEIAENQQVLVIDKLDVHAQTVRLTINDIWPGKKHDDACISEIELWGDVEDGRPAGAALRGQLFFIDRMLSKLDDMWTRSTPEPAAYLQSIGIHEQSLQAVRYSRVNSARRLKANLDADPEEESLIEVSLFNSNETTHKTLISYYYLWIDDEAHGLGVLGQRHLQTFACQDPKQPTELRIGNRPVRISNTEVRFEKMHRETINDTLIKWTSMNACDGPPQGNDGLWVLTVEQGALTTLLSWSVDSEYDRVRGKELKPRRVFTWARATPIDIMILANGQNFAKYTFAEDTYLYQKSSL